jgi:hypothetical protein
VPVEESRRPTLEALLLLLLLLPVPQQCKECQHCCSLRNTTHRGCAVPVEESRRPTLSRDGPTGNAEPCSSSSSSSRQAAVKCQ